MEGKIINNYLTSVLPNNDTTRLTTFPAQFIEDQFYETRQIVKSKAKFLTFW